MTSVRRMSLPCLLVALLALVASTAVTTAPASAALRGVDDAEGMPAVPSFLIEPVGQDGPYFALELEPGDEETLTVALGNAGEADAPARTFAADVYTLVNGGFGIETEGEEPSGPTTWLDYEAETLDIPPGRMVEREFTVSVPEDAEPGQHITGLVIQTAEPVAIGGSDMLKQNIVKAIAVFVTVPGELEPKLRLGEAALNQTPAGTNLTVGVENAGNVLLKPAGTVTMTTADGDPVLTAPVTMGSVYAGHETVVEVAIPTVLPPGDYLVDVELKDAETKAKAKAEGLAVTAVDPNAASPTAAPIRIAEVRAEPVLDPATGALQVVNVAVVISNEGGPLNGARLTLRVERDGELVEDLPLSSSLVVAAGETEIAQRYVPLGRWEPGTYTFAATLEATDLATGQVTLLDTAEAASPVTVE